MFIHLLVQIIVKEKIMLMNKMLVLKEFFERYQTLAIILVLSIILIAVFYLKKLYNKLRLLCGRMALWH